MDTIDPNFDHINPPSALELRKLESLIAEKLTPDNLHPDKNSDDPNEKWKLRLSNCDRFNREDGLLFQPEILIISDESLELKITGTKIFIMETVRSSRLWNFAITDIYVFATPISDYESATIFMSSCDQRMLDIHKGRDKDLTGFICTFFEEYRHEKCDQFEVLRLIQMLEEAKVQN